VALETDHSALATLGLFGEQEGFPGDGEIVVLKVISGGGFSSWLRKHRERLPVTA